MSTNLEKSAVATGLEKVHFHSNPTERQCQRMFKLLHNCTHLTHLEINAQIPQARLQQYVNYEIPDIQAGFRKSKGARDQIAIIHWIIEKAREFQKNIYFCFVDYTKPFPPGGLVFPSLEEFSTAYCDPHSQRLWHSQ